MFFMLLMILMQGPDPKKVTSWGLMGKIKPTYRVLCVGA